MDIFEFEDLILHELKSVVENILMKTPTPAISAKTRAGAEISELLEKQFVLETQNHPYLKKSQSSPAGATKNPWDALTYFTLNEHEELIWIDFKAIKITSTDSNPDIGTPDKIIKLIKSGAFYLVYIFVYYKATDKGIEFVKNKDNEFVKLYFLKDISPTFHRNPKNQLQVNISAPPVKRTREEFIDLLYEKIIESHHRQIEISEKALKEIEESNVINELKMKNMYQEEKIRKI